jgi:hypothetical protein
MVYAEKVVEIVEAVAQPKKEQWEILGEYPLQMSISMNCPSKWACCRQNALSQNLRNHALKSLVRKRKLFCTSSPVRRDIRISKEKAAKTAKKERLDGSFVPLKMV